MSINGIGRQLGLAAAFVVAAQPALAGVTSGMLLTNCATATYALPSGAGVNETDPGTNSVNVPNSCTAWVLVTDQPQLCLKIWKTAVEYGSWTPTTAQYPGSPVCFQIGFSNCGNFSGISVHINDMLPSNTMRAPPPIGAVWVTQNGAPVSYTGWATSLAGPWLTAPPASQLNPHYMRWILNRVGMHKTGYVRYCLTIL